jgi:Tetratricopeptide repeat
MDKNCPTANDSKGATQMKHWLKTLTTAAVISGWILGVDVAGAISPPAQIHSIKGNGKVKVQRKNRTTWDRVEAGKDLQDGDQIFPDKGMKVWVLCSNKRDPVLVKSGVVSGIGSICIFMATRPGDGAALHKRPERKRPELSQDDAVIVIRDARGSDLDLATLGGFDPTLPYLITPRHTLLLSPKPLLRWNAVPGNPEYTLEVKSPTVTLWQTKTQDNKALYAGPALEVGTPYSVVILTNNGKSSLEEKTPDGKNSTSHLEFRILRPEQIPKIANTKPSEIPDIFALVDFYRNYHLQESLLPSYQLPRDYAETYTLSGEAIALLESAIQKGQSTPLIHRTLGDLYWQTGLIQPAETEYRRAITLAKAPENLEDATLAQEHLGQLYWTIGKKAEAQQAYLQAKEGYQALGKKSKVEELQTQLNRLKS